MSIRSIVLLVLAFTGVIEAQQFPNSVVDSSTLLNTTNFYSSLTTSATGIGDVIIPISSLSVHSTLNPPTAVTIDSEVIKICTATTTQLTVCANGRGFDGTTATTHVLGSSVRGTYIATLNNSVVSEVKSIENALGSHLSNLSSNARTFGAIGDGVTDDTLAIQACVNSAWAIGSVCHVPSGQYKVSVITLPTPTKVGQQVTIEGDGRGYEGVVSTSNFVSGTAFLCKNTSGGCIQYVNHNTAPNAGYSLRSFSLVGLDRSIDSNGDPITTNSGSGILIDSLSVDGSVGSAPQVYIENVGASGFYGVSTAAFWLNGPEDSSLINAYADFNNSCAHLSGSFNANTLVNFTCNTSENDGVYIESSETINWSGGLIQSNRKTGLHLVGVLASTFTGIHFENNNSSRTANASAIAIESGYTAGCPSNGTSVGTCWSNQNLQFNGITMNEVEPLVIHIFGGQRGSEWQTSNIEFNHGYANGIPDGSIVLEGGTFDIFFNGMLGAYSQAKIVDTTAGQNLIQEGNIVASTNPSNPAFQIGNGGLLVRDDSSTGVTSASVQGGANQNFADLFTFKANNGTLYDRVMANGTLGVYKGIQDLSTATKPTCNSSLDGLSFIEKGTGPSGSDLDLVCIATPAGTFSWVSRGSGTFVDSQFTTFAAACTAAGTNTLKITQVWSALASQTCSARLQFVSGGLLQVAANSTVTLTGSVEAAMSLKIFDTSATSAFIKFGQDVVPTVHAAWFGTVCDGATNTVSALQSAIDSAAVYGTYGSYYVMTAPIQVQAGTCIIGSTLRLYGSSPNLQYSGVILRGNGKNSTYLVYTGTSSGSLIQTIGPYLKISDMYLKNANSSGWLSGIDYNGISGVGISSQGNISDVVIDCNSYSGDGIAIGRNHFQADQLIMVHPFIVGCSGGIGVDVLDSNSLSVVLNAPTISNAWIGVRLYTSTNFSIYGGEFDYNDINFMPSIGAPFVASGIRSEGSKRIMYSQVGGSPQPFTLESYNSSQVNDIRPATSLTAVSGSNVTFSNSGFTFGDGIRITASGGGFWDGYIASMTDPLHATLSGVVGAPVVVGSTVSLSPALIQYQMWEQQLGPYTHIGNEFNDNTASGAFTPQYTTADVRAAQIWVGNSWGGLGNLAIGPYSTTVPPSTTTLIGNNIDNNAEFGGPFQLYNLSSGQDNTIQVPLESGVNSLISTGTITPYTGTTLPPLTTGVTIQIQLAHTLTGNAANALVYSGGTPIPIRSHFNHSNNIATGYQVGSMITLRYDGSVWQDMSQ